METSTSHMLLNHSNYSVNGKLFLSTLWELLQVTSVRVTFYFTLYEGSFDWSVQTGVEVQLSNQLNISLLYNSKIHLFLFIIWFYHLPLPCPLGCASGLSGRSLEEGPLWTICGNSLCFSEQGSPFSHSQIKWLLQLCKWALTRHIYCCRWTVAGKLGIARQRRLPCAQSTQTLWLQFASGSWGNCNENVSDWLNTEGVPGGRAGESFVWSNSTHCHSVQGRKVRQFALFTQLCTLAAKHPCLLGAMTSPLCSSV